MSLLKSDLDLQMLDLKFNWHPCSQMKDYEKIKPIIIKRAAGSYIELSDGKQLIDAISSWWCKSLGHQHPVLKNAMIRQLDQFEHVIYANTTHEIIVTLSEMLASLMPGLNKVFYVGDGSSAVEIALKMSLHARLIEKNSTKKRFVSLRNGYHGETIGALSVSDLGKFRLPYASLLFEAIYIDVPYVNSTDDSLWNNASEAWLLVEQQLAPYSQEITAIILEPIVQGAGGMKMYSQDFLRCLVGWSKFHHIHVIADEIMTGIGRTGKMLACEHAGITPDFICLSKGLTSGFMTFSAVITTNEVYELFYDDYETGKAFLHSHTYSGHALGAAVAVAVLQVMKDQSLCQRANDLQVMMIKAFKEIAEKTGRLMNIRGIGAIVAAELNVENHKRAGHALFCEAITQGALLRPLGNTVYWLPPLTVTNTTITELKNITLNSILSVFGSLS